MTTGMKTAFLLGRTIKLLGVLGTLALAILKFTIMPEIGLGLVATPILAAIALMVVALLLAALCNLLIGGIEATQRRGAASARRRG